MSSSQDQEPKRTDRPRRAYAAPAIVESATFETLALACAKALGETECDPTIFPGAGFSES